MRPNTNEVGNVCSYYSGHYEHHGLNCQAACDAELRFMFFGVVVPGSTNDNIAYHLAGNLAETIESLPLGKYFVGDAAYTVSEKLLIPFSGSQRQIKEQDAFNFFKSQMRIRIEMSFGLLVNKWRILKDSLCYRYTTNAEILMGCAMLHNYCINMDGNIIRDDDYQLNKRYMDINNLNSINNIQMVHDNTAPMNMVY